MSFDQRENLREAILKKRARIIELERALNAPPLSEHRNHAIHGGNNSRLHLEEERQHLLLAVAELERELVRLDQTSRIVPAPVQTPFDSRLCDLKLRHAINRLHAEAAQCWRRANADAKRRGNSAHLYPAFVEYRMQVLRNHLEEVDRIMRRVQLTDGEVNPEFIRSTLVPRVFAIIAAQQGAIQHVLDLHRQRTGKHNPASGLYLVQKLSQLKSELAARYEAEAIELGKQIARANRITSQGAEAARGDASTAPSNGSTADLWRELGTRFRQQAHEEEEIARDPDRLLHASCSYDEHPEVSHERGRAAQGMFCLLKPPATGVWNVSDGVNPDFQERLRVLATRAGLALGCPTGTDAEDFWLDRLWNNVVENGKTGVIFSEKNGKITGGIISRVCVVSATFCARLERQALEEARRAENNRNASRIRALPAMTDGAQPKTAKGQSRPRAALTDSARRAKAVGKVREELRMIKPRMHNGDYYGKLRREHHRYLIFALADRDSEVKQWVENVQERRDLTQLAQEIVARKFGVTAATVRTDWSHRGSADRHHTKRR